jgi:RNA ligase (TIGR02306 family)
MDIRLDEVVSIESKFDSDSLRYDITVADNHNFFANNILVHNCQNLTEEIQSAVGLLFEVTEKLEGTSMTCYLINGKFGVCSRNLDLKDTADNTMWQVAHRDHIEAKMREQFGDGFAIQGELIGPGVQGNIYKLSKPEFRVFDVYDIAAGEYLDPKYRQEVVARMGLQHVPVVVMDRDLGVGTVDELLTWAHDWSKLNPKQTREGIVFKQMSGGMTFKAISNQYLLGQR